MESPLQLVPVLMLLVFIGFGRRTLRGVYWSLLLFALSWLLMAFALEHDNNVVFAMGGPLASMALCASLLVLRRRPSQSNQPKVSEADPSDE